MRFFDRRCLLKPLQITGIKMLWFFMSCNVYLVAIKHFDTSLVWLCFKNVVKENVVQNTPEGLVMLLA